MVAEVCRSPGAVETIRLNCGGKSKNRGIFLTCNAFVRKEQQAKDSRPHADPF